MRACGDVQPGVRSALALILLMALAIFAVAALWAPARAQDAEAQVLTAPPLKIAAFIRSRPDRCYDDGSGAAQRAFAEREIARINARGGIYGRPLALTEIAEAPIVASGRDGDAERARRDAAREEMYGAIRGAIQDPDLLAMIGLSSSTSGERLFKDLGEELAAGGAPMLTDISVAEVYQGVPNAFSTRPAQEIARGPVIAAFLRQQGFQRVALIQRTDAIWIRSMGRAIKSRVDATRIVSEHELIMQGRDIDPEQLTAIAADLRESRPDAVVIAAGRSQTQEVIEAIEAIGGLQTSVVVTTSLDRLAERLDQKRRNPVFGLAWSRLPGISDEKLRRLVSGGAPGAWIFEGAKNPDAPGWASGACQETETPDPRYRDPLDLNNERAIQRGATMADMIRLAAAGAIAAGPEATLEEQRAAIKTALTETYAIGKAVFRGPYANWWFDPTNRVASQTPFLLALFPGRAPQLATTQFVRARSGDLKPIETLFADIDLIRVSRVSENDRSFFADFYLSMRAKDDASIERIDFTNAFIDPRRDSGRLLSVEELHGGGPSDLYPSTVKVYRVSGRFVFEPELARYPFDQQRFSIDIRPKSGGASFIVQPPPAELRDRDVESDDWSMVSQFVSVGNDFVPIIDSFSNESSVVPFYTASYVWIMKREATDYYLRVVVPLAFILWIAYLSIFIPLSRFEAIITIQVTALLSAVALYLSLPELDSNDATISDQIFLFDYMLISIMILISIVRIAERVLKRWWLLSVLATIHIIGIPAAVVAMGYLVITQTL